MIDTSNDGLIQLAEMESAIEVFQKLSIKEMHSIYNFFDIDNNGVIDKQEFHAQLRKAQKMHAKHQS